MISYLKTIITIHALSTTNKFRLNSQNISKKEESSDELFKKLIAEVWYQMSSSLSD